MIASRAAMLAIATACLPPTARADRGSAGGAGSRAPHRWLADLELVTIRRPIDGDQGELNSFFVIGAGHGWRLGPILVVAGGAAGFLTVQARVGVHLQLSPESSGVVARLEIRPQVASLACGEGAVLGSAGVGYRWVTRERWALWLIPSVEAGPAWIRASCTQDRGAEGPASAVFHIGGTIALGTDF